MQFSWLVGVLGSHFILDLDITPVLSLTTGPDVSGLKCHWSEDNFENLPVG